MRGTEPTQAAVEAIEESLTYMGHKGTRYPGVENVIVDDMLCVAMDPSLGIDRLVPLREVLEVLAERYISGPIVCSDFQEAAATIKQEFGG